MNHLITNSRAGESGSNIFGAPVSKSQAKINRKITRDKTSDLVVARHRCSNVRGKRSEDRNQLRTDIEPMLGLPLPSLHNVFANFVQTSRANKLLYFPVLLRLIPSRSSSSPPPVFHAVYCHKTKNP